MQDYPIIVTACLDRTNQAILDAMRRRYFPVGRTVVGAHLTLFHAIPASHRALLHHVAKGVCAMQPRFRAAMPKVRSLGRGVAVVVDSPTLVSLRERLADPLRASLSAQDACRFSPHVTLANKMLPDAAKALFTELQETWQAREVEIEALALWHYTGPHWQLDVQLALGETMS